MSDQIRSSLERGVQIDARIGSPATPREASAPVEPRRKRWRDRLPNPAELAALLVNGEIQLPPRYFRGYFLDLII
jgi:hypothetical protein